MWHFLFTTSAESGTRTRTPFARHRILSPVRLPIPPSRQGFSKTFHVFAHKIACTFACKFCAILTTTKTECPLFSFSHSGSLQKIKGNPTIILFSGMINDFICTSKLQNNDSEGKKISSKVLYSILLHTL